ncbi:MAG: exodeoxyribonuclease V subunit beta [Betaproteobacteria bacterium]|nr:exodeoxyribonuclease V subunit beta [Betaproteobacteria bacterium]MDE1954092.1 exodeoxyribonuclease V subunit beta [Betaproteobacteria bacterium]MDE2151202.1 exodeoxyribonuclease V subunit beta [Betaproteobacteria bacterium]
MSDTVHPLDALRLPLWGSRLIEASAGTGKTWTIAALYLRLVLGHGESGSAWREPLAPARILVMTFTRAATQELRERIRARLAQAAACFRGEAEPAADDELLRQLLHAAGDAAQRETAAWRLALAADSMDDAAVFTIDAWCQRMLREHAFDSGSLFDEELLADDTALRQRALRDVWRREIYPLRGEELGGLLRLWPEYPAFEAAVGARLARRAATGSARELEQAGALGPAWSRVDALRREAMRGLRAAWREQLGPMRAWIEAQCAQDSPFNARMVSAARLAPWFDALQQWAQADDGEAVELEDKAWQRLQAQGLREALKKGRELQPPEGFEQLAGLREQLRALPRADAELADRACAAAERRLLELKRQARSFGFVDLQQRLAQALEGPGGAGLRQRIREQYPVALLDEFQDTSALQYRLFDSLYRVGANDPEAALLLIGDPKQSIYGFRGADIDSYIRARRATAGRHYALDTNYRSTQALVQAVNRLFERAEGEQGGAFGYRDAGDDPLPFVPVRARGREETLCTAAGELPALWVEYDTELRNSSEALADYARACAETVVGLLGDPHCGFRGPAGLRRLRPRDIAVLVRTREQAWQVRAELGRRRVASVYLSERESVLASAEARDLLRWLRAVAEPRDARLARAGLANASFGLELAELEALARDDEVFEAHAQLLLELHELWRSQGVLPMLRATLHRLGLARRWLARDGGERRLTNVLHLAELLQQASSGVDGEQALLRWLEQAVAGRAGAADEQELRLESEADLVRVVTIHKSKGLEYPVVLLPFATHFRSADGDDQDESEPDGDDAGGGEGGDAESRRLREDLRLLYVALTRARHAVWMGAAPLRRGRASQCLLARSALGRLLGALPDAGPEQLETLLRATWGALPGLRLQPRRPVEPPSLLRDEARTVELREPEVYDARFERDWHIASFSALARNLAPLRAAFGARQHESDDTAQETQPAGVRAAAARHAFARGTRAGSFLHEQLAWLAEQGFADDAATRSAFAQRCARQGWEAEADDAWVWLQQVLRTALPPLGASLRQLRASLAEMEFWFPVDAASAAALDRLCAQAWLGTRERARLDERRVHGLVMGFADLVFEHEGRYWVLDYKSNALGERDADYHAEALARAMAEHRYDVQAMLYLLALHRLLRQRLGAAYEPRRQLGGALCLFLRGIEGPERGCFAMPADVDWLDRLDRLLGVCGTAEEPRR